MSRSFLELKNISKFYGSITVLDGISFKNSHDTIGILGANGAGKSTLFKLILGLVKANSGSFSFDFTFDEIRVVPENPKLPKNLRIREWHNLLVKTFGSPNTKEPPFEILGLDSEKYLGNLSAGQHKKASLLPLFYGKPKLLLIDEPTNYLDINSRNKILHLIINLINKFKLKLLVSSHRLDEIKLLAKEVLLIKDGQILGVINLEENEISSIVFRSRDKNFEKLLVKENISYTCKRIINTQEFVIDYNTDSLDFLKRLIIEKIKIEYIGFIDKFDSTVEGVFNE